MWIKLNSYIESPLNPMLPKGFVFTHLALHGQKARRALATVLGALGAAESKREAEGQGVRAGLLSHSLTVSKLVETQDLGRAPHPRT